MSEINPVTHELEEWKNLKYYRKYDYGHNQKIASQHSYYHSEKLKKYESNGFDWVIKSLKTRVANDFPKIIGKKIYVLYYRRSLEMTIKFNWLSSKGYEVYYFEEIGTRDCFDAKTSKYR